MRRVALAAAASYAVARGVKAVAKARPGVFSSWDRPSYTGASVSLTEGLAVVAGLAVGVFCVPGRCRKSTLVGVAAAGVAGAIDDHWEHSFPAEAKGFSGHLKALKEGKVTSGTVKIAAISSGSALCALGLPRQKASHPAVKVGTWMGQTALIAGSANLVNLLDVRPGRALKVCATGATIGLLCSRAKNDAQATRCVHSSVLGTTLAVVSDDLAGRTMLGDLGANAVGAAFGSTLAQAKPIVMWSSLLVVVALTLASEKYSFSAVIEAHPVLNALDRLGRS